MSTDSTINQQIQARYGPIAAHYMASGERGSRNYASHRQRALSAPDSPSGL